MLCLTRYTDMGHLLAHFWLYYPVSSSLAVKNVGQVVELPPASLRDATSASPSPPALKYFHSLGS